MTKILGLLGFIMLLTACSKMLDTASVEAQIKTDLSQKGNLSIRSISCPEVKSQIGQSFECVGALEPDGGFFVTVEQQDKQGTVTWTVPNAWRLLNLSSLEAEMQQRLQGQESVQVDCAGLYRPTKPGDQFECQLKGRSPQPETILVQVEPEGRVNWREVRQAVPKPAVSGAAAPNASTAAASPSTLLAPLPDEPPAQIGVKDSSGWVPLDD